MTKLDHRRMANAIRGLSIDAVETAGHGHPGAAMGMARDDDAIAEASVQVGQVLEGVVA